MIYSYIAMIVDNYEQEWYDAGEVEADDIDDAVYHARLEILSREISGGIRSIRILNVEPVISAEHDIIGGFIFEDIEDLRKDKNEI